MKVKCGHCNAVVDVGKAEVRVLLLNRTDELILLNCPKCNFETILEVQNEYTKAIKKRVKNHLNVLEQMKLVKKELPADRCKEVELDLKKLKLASSMLLNKYKPLYEISLPEDKQC